MKKAQELLQVLVERNDRERRITLVLMPVQEASRGSGLLEA